MSDNRKCPNPACGTLNSADAAFCFNCGTRLQELEARCPNLKCGALVHAGEKFCPNCGTRLTAVPAATGPEPRPAASVSAEPGTRSGPPSQITLSKDNKVVWAAVRQSCNLQDPEIRLKRHSLNALFVNLRRRHNLPGPASPEVVRACSQTLEAHLDSLAGDSVAQTFLPIATILALVFQRLQVMQLPAIEHDNIEIDFLAIDDPLSQRTRTLLAGTSDPATLFWTAVFTLAIADTDLFWPDRSFHRMEVSLKSDNATLSRVICQSLRELFYLTYPTTSLKNRFLSEEDCKLANDYYPDFCRSDVRQLLVRLRLACEKGEKDFPTPGAENDSILLTISPLSVAEIAQRWPISAANLGLMSGDRFPYRPLGPTEAEALKRFMAVGLENFLLSSFPKDGEPLLSVFLAMRDEQASNADRFWSGLSLHQAAELSPYYLFFEQAHWTLTRYCNIFGPRIPAKKWDELPHRPLRSPGASWAALKLEYAKVDRDYAEAMFPDCKTIESLLSENPES